MTIKFPCPHCKKMLSVKEHLAGKKVACPACKGAITIPAPAPTPAAPDVEALAAAAFADEPVKKEVQEPQFIEFNCYYCDEKVKINTELQGKQAPCPNPECRRIIKVPLLKKEGPKDWRTVDMRTPLVAQRTEAAPEGAWGSTTSQGRVSRQSLEDAEALPVAVVSTGPGRWIVRGLAAVVLLAVVGGGWWGFSSWSRNRVETQALAKAEAGLNAQAFLADDLATAEVHRAIGEYLILTRKAEQARIRFQQARQPVSKEGAASRAHDFALAELAASQVELGGSPKEVEHGTRIKGETAMHEIVQTLLKMHYHDVRVEAVREVTRRLIARKEGRRAFVLPTQVGRPEEAAELTAVIGLELIAAKQMEDATALVELALRRYTEPLPAEAGEPVEAAAPADDPSAKPRETVKKSPLSVALIAFFVALERRDAFLPPAPTGVGMPQVIAAGYAEGLGYRGKRDEARAVVKTTSTDGRVLALVGLAAALVAHEQAEAARTDLEEALGLLDRSKDLSPATLFRLVRVGVRAGMTDALLPAAKAISDKDTRGRALLEIVRAQLAALKGRAEDAILDIIDKDTLAHSLALSALARHNARVDSPKTTRNSVDSWEEKTRPFGYVGVALGSRDARSQ